MTDKASQILRLLENLTTDIDNDEIRLNGRFDNIESRLEGIELRLKSLEQGSLNTKDKIVDAMQEVAAPVIDAVEKITRPHKPSLLERLKLVKPRVGENK